MSGHPTRTTRDTRLVTGPFPLSLSSSNLRGPALIVTAVVASHQPPLPPGQPPVHLRSGAWTAPSWRTNFQSILVSCRSWGSHIKMARKLLVILLKRALNGIPICFIGPFQMSRPGGTLPGPALALLSLQKMHSRGDEFGNHRDVTAAVVMLSCYENALIQP